ncbi:MAG: hypothetical protein WBD00_07600 [Candidatus Omnitrophota bacterium]
MKKNIWLILTGLFVGAVVGLGASFVCNNFLSGTCPLTRDPATSTLLGAIVGAGMATLGSAKRGK